MIEQLAARAAEEQNGARMTDSEKEAADELFDRLDDMRKRMRARCRDESLAPRERRLAAEMASDIEERQKDLCGTLEWNEWVAEKSTA